MCGSHKSGRISVNISLKVIGEKGAKEIKVSRSGDSESSASISYISYGENSETKLYSYEGVFVYAVASLPQNIADRTSNWNVREGAAIHVEWGGKGT